MRKSIIGMTLAITLLVSPFAMAKDNSIKPTENQAAKEQEIAKKKSFSLSQIDALIDKGYTYDEILDLSADKVDKILTQDLNSSEITEYEASKKSTGTAASVTATPPAGYTCVASVPNGGGTNEWFHPSTNTTETYINYIVALARTGAQNIFNSSYTYPDLRYSYYLCGEWGEDPGYTTWCHEGIDLKNAVNSTASVRSPISGVVTKSSTSGKYVNIYNSGLGITMNFQHLNNIDGTGVLAEGQYVSENQFLGNQNTSDGHVHVQTCAHANCTSVHSGRDLTLNCINPYSYIQ
ncbi:MAG TPA: hypothetical protein VN426_05875 [Syntrophomonadaceae bacterium]|nr:hypothetical protein [Syntrophomonadaceae bacterium]